MKLTQRDLKLIESALVESVTQCLLDRRTAGLCLDAWTHCSEEEWLKAEDRWTDLNRRVQLLQDLHSRIVQELTAEGVAA